VLFTVLPSRCNNELMNEFGVEWSLVSQWCTHTHLNYA